MTQSLWNLIGFPESSVLGNRVYKKLFVENADAGAADRRALSDDVEVITWTHKLAPETAGIPSFIDDQREYNEIAVLSVETKTQKRIGRIAQLIHRTIPYPVILVFFKSDNDKVLLSLAPKRFSQSDREKIVAEEFFATDWIDLAERTANESKFVESLRFSMLPQHNLFAFYSAMVERMIALNCARFSGAYALSEGSAKYQDRAARLAKCQELEQNLATLRTEIKNETQFNRKVELNMQIKQLSDALQSETAKL
jgi:hypothetical protein